MGKGSTRRPAQVPNAVVDANWERTFGTRKEVANEIVREAQKHGECDVVICLGCGGSGERSQYSRDLPCRECAGMGWVVSEKALSEYHPSKPLQEDRPNS